MMADGVLLTVVVSPKMLVSIPVVVKVVAGAVAEVAADRKDAVSSSCWG